MNILASSMRINSIDILRGLIIILMAVDHTRDMFALTPFMTTDLTQTTPAWFFTRWMTHFCAPVFVFLAGTSAFLYGSKINNKKRLSVFLMSRGIWLILIELVVINWSWEFIFLTSADKVELGVIWVLGASMILLAGLMWLKDKWIAFISLLLIFGHNALDGMPAEAWGSMDWLWNLLHQGKSFIPLTDNFGIFVLYPIIPWVGVMGIGYVFGHVMHWDARNRQKLLLIAGLVITLGFIALRFSNFYGDAALWGTQKDGIYTLLSFLNTTKYPPSLLYLMMTLGPTLLLLLLFERCDNCLTTFFKTFGSVPFFFYILHIPLANAGALVYHYFVYGYAFNLWSTATADLPPSYVPSFLLLYVAWGILLLTLYPICHLFARYKAGHKQYRWLRFL